jgi:hypothetical protein
MNSSQHLYLFILEIAPLTVGKVYNPLPPHLTLMSRFWSELSPDDLAGTIKPLFDRTSPVELAFGDSVQLGPKKIVVHLIAHTKELKELHTELRNLLDTVNVTYAYPQFTGDNHKPHVSKREGDGFRPGHKQMATVVYLIEVEIKGEEHLRHVRGKFDLKG